MRNRAFSTPGVLVVVMMVLALAQPASARGTGNTLRVGSCPECDYSSIQEAVDAAEPGTEILVYPLGVAPNYYFETVIVRKDNLKILAQGSGVMVLSATDDACFDVKADHVVIQGFDMTGPLVRLWHPV